MQHHALIGFALERAQLLDRFGTAAHLDERAVRAVCTFTTNGDSI